MTEAPAAAMALEALFEGEWRDCLPRAERPLTLHYLSRGPHLDSPTVHVVRDRRRAWAVVQSAAAAAPDMVARSMRRTREAHEALAALDRSRVLTPLAVGQTMGVSCALLPFCVALPGDRIGRWWTDRRLHTPMADWLHAVAGATQRAADDSACTESLSAMATRPGVGVTLCRAAERAAERLARGDWSPRHVLMHGDLWRGNVMLRADSDGDWASRLVVIDWSGSRLDGWPFFDLVRLADSTGIGVARLRAEFARHAATLGCGLVDARSAVVAALAATLARLEHFPIEQFAAMGERALARLDEAIGAADR